MMNWVGGSLHRSRKNNVKGSAAKIQKQHFARVEHNFTNRPRSPPVIDLSVFRSAISQGSSPHKHRCFVNVRPPIPQASRFDASSSADGKHMCQRINCGLQIQMLKVTVLTWDRVML